MLSIDNNKQKPVYVGRNPRKTDEKGQTLMTEAYVKYICKSKQLYSTPELNDLLYLHFQGMCSCLHLTNPSINVLYYAGFVKIENLENYTGVKSLWLESNGIEKIENLGHMTELRCLQVMTTI
jgi:dynein assembly factor 1